MSLCYLIVIIKNRRSFNNIQDRTYHTVCFLKKIGGLTYYCPDKYSEIADWLTLKIEKTGIFANKEVGGFSAREITHVPKSKCRVVPLTLYKINKPRMIPLDELLPE